MSWKLLALASAGFAGLTAVFSKVGVQNIPSTQATLLRVLIILPVLGALVVLQREWTPVGTLPPKSLIFLVLSGLATGLSWLCYYRALQMGPTSVVAPIDKLSLVVAIVLAVVFLGEKLSSMQWVGTALMAIGAVLLVWR